MDIVNFIDCELKRFLHETEKHNIIYRGGLPLDNQKIKSDGVSFTKDKRIAEYWAGSIVNGKVSTYRLTKDANILTSSNFPERIIPKNKPYNHQDKERIVNYAYVKKYDGVDLSDFFNESELRIFNLQVIQHLTLQ